MPDADALRAPDTPFEAFRFAVEIQVPGVSPRVCNAAFAECLGPSVTLETRTVREGGSHAARVQLTGSRTFGLVTLRRGMSRNLDLWRWVSAVMQDGVSTPRGELRAETVIALLGPDGAGDRTRIVLRGCLPVRFSGPALNASGNSVAIEELQLAYESLELLGPDEKPAAPTLPPLARARLLELDPSLEHEARPGFSTTVQFNPECLRVTHRRALAGDAPTAGVSRLSAVLLFDVTVPPAPGSEPVKDVRRLTRGLGYFMASESHPGKPAGPPRGVRFSWGSFRFDGFMESMEESLELFSAEGIPLRARVAVELVRHGIVDTIEAWTG